MSDQQPSTVYQYSVKVEEHKDYTTTTVHVYGNNPGIVAIDTIDLLIDVRSKLIEKGFKVAPLETKKEDLSLTKLGTAYEEHHT